MRLLKTGIDPTRPGGGIRTTSLRARWTKGFTQLTAVIVVAGLAGLLGTGLLYRAFSDSAVQMERAAATSTKLRAGVVAHAIAVAAPVTTAQQRHVEALQASTLAGFEQAIRTEGAGNAQGLFTAALQRWRTVVEIVRRANRPADSAIRDAALTTREPKILSLLDQAGLASRADAGDDVLKAQRRFREVMGALGLVELLAVVLAVRLARRLSSEVLRPVGTLRDAANQLAAGELDHRVVVDRNDELGELAVSFNAMADSIVASQLTLSRAANTDALSGLANRAAFDVRLEAALAQPDRRGGSTAVMFVDLDDFKGVNDSLGHAAGDDVLRVVANRLNEVVRPGDVVARLGGDEFALLLDNLVDAKAAFGLAQRVVSTVAQPIKIGDAWTEVGASVGVAVRRDDSTLDSLMRQADVAMYTAKANGKNRAQRYDSKGDKIAMARQALRDDLPHAADRGELVVEYQPVVDLDHGTIVGLEALVRWQHPIRGLLPPSTFIELAEETGAIIAIGDWVLATATRQVRRWQCRYGLPGLFISVNASVRQLDAPSFAEHVLSVIDETRLDPSNLVVEITESLLADPDAGGAGELSALRARGVRIALDDFGTGHSSVGYLRQLPLDILKVDRSFVSATSAEGTDDVLLEAIINMAHHLGLDVIPEGIEDLGQLDRLKAMGCTLGQGFLLSRPLSSSAVETLLATTSPFPHILFREIASDEAPISHLSV
jgi:diguanylate cyclase (GGDEF)-like protein